jgi:hypothetical protein
MSDPQNDIAVEALVAETRTLREALQDLIQSMRRERMMVEQMLAELPARPRLTQRQQDRLRAHLARKSGRPPA